MPLADKRILEFLAAGQLRKGLECYADEREQTAVSAMVASKDFAEHQRAKGAYEEAGKLRRLAQDVEAHEATRNVSLKK